ITHSSSFCSFGDGFGFVIIFRLPYSVVFSDRFMGLPESEYPVDVQDSFIIVEFDTSFDPSLGDINDNHADADVNFAVSLASIDAFPKGVDWKSGKQMVTMTTDVVLYLSAPITTFTSMMNNSKIDDEQL
ncbi:non-specific serine,threonine protein kinase, partial [Sarracenia purpurea var. burkii]